MVQAVGHIAPGLNILLGLTFIVSFAEVTAPIAYVLGGLICLGVAIVLTQLAKQFAGAGGYFLYVSRTVGPRAGWITTWLWFSYSPVAVASVCAFTGKLVQDTVKAQYDVNISWYIWFFLFLAVVTAFTYFGIRLSIRALLVLAGLEIGIFLALGLSGLASPGPGGFNGASAGVKTWFLRLAVPCIALSDNSCGNGSWHRACSPLCWAQSCWRSQDRPSSSRQPSSVSTS